MEKATAGARGNTSPLRSQRVKAKVLALADYHQRRALGEASPTIPGMNPGNVVRVKNVSGSLIERGTVVQLGSTDLDMPPYFYQGPTYEFGSVMVSDRQFFFSGSLPAGSITELSKNYVIAAEDLPTDGSYGVCVAAGLAVAWVDVTDLDHSYASIVDDTGVMVSSEFGHVEILSVPVDTGVQQLVVRMGQAGCNFLWGKSDDNNSSGSTAIISIWGGQAGSTYDTGRNLQVSNLVTVSIGNKVVVVSDYVFAYKVVAKGW